MAILIVAPGVKANMSGLKGYAGLAIESVQVLFLEENVPNLM